MEREQHNKAHPKSNYICKISGIHTNGGVTYQTVGGVPIKTLPRTSSGSQWPLTQLTSFSPRNARATSAAHDMRSPVSSILTASLLPLTKVRAGFRMQWKQTVWMLIPITGMSMLTVLFIVLWQAITHQTDSINQLQTRMDDLELKLETNPSVSTQLLEQQLKQLQSNQRSLEDRLSRTEREPQRLWPRNVPVQPASPFSDLMP